MEVKKNEKRIKPAVIVVLVLALVIVAWWLIGKSTGPKVAFKENIVFEYGEQLSDQELIDRVVDKDKSNYNTLTISSSSFDTKTVTSKYGEERKPKTYKIEMTLDQEYAEKNITYDVLDTKKPVFKGESNFEVPFGSQFIIEEHVKATDEVDGDLKVEFTGEVQTNKAGTYVVKTSATDINGNVTEKEITVKVLEEVKEEVKPEESNTTASNNNSNTTKPNTGNTGGAASGSKPSTPSKPNTGGGNTSNAGGNTGGNNGGTTGNTGGNTGGGTTTPPKPTRPAPEAPSGMKFYKDYGSFDGCSAVIYSVLENHAREWSDNFCDDYGYMYYTPYN